MEITVGATRSASSGQRPRTLAFALLASACVLAPEAAEPAPSPDHAVEGDRPRARDLGLTPGILPAGPLNAITDVAGVRVGHVTLIAGAGVRTGVTAILAHNGNLFQEKVPAALYVGNGFGKLIGATQVNELGVIETPIVLTNTLSVWTAANAIATYVLSMPGNEEVRSVNPLVGETNDGFLNDIRGRHVKERHVLAAIERAASGPVAEGSVGAGTGTRCFELKGGIGTSSRRLPAQLGGYTVGVLVQSNFGGILQMDGLPVGRHLNRYYLQDAVSDTGADGSIMMVVATDAPLRHRALLRLARRAMLGLARTGGISSHGSGDYVIAFSTAAALRQRHQRATPVVSAPVLADHALSPLFVAVIEATEEAIYNSLLQATTVAGFSGHTAEALPLAALRAIARDAGRSWPEKSAPHGRAR